MISPKTHYIVNVAARLTTIPFAVASLALFTTTLLNVLNPEFPSEIPGFSALPVGALALSIVWNIIAIFTIGKMGRFLHPYIDGIITVLLIALGTLGFYHDDTTYLSTGMYRNYRKDAWLWQEIRAGILLIITTLFQIFIIIWAFYLPKTAITSNPTISISTATLSNANPNPTSVSPPSYLEGDYVKELQENKDKQQFEMEWQSVSSVDGTSSVYKKDLERGM